MELERSGEAAGGHPYGERQPYSATMGWPLTRWACTIMHTPSLGSRVQRLYLFLLPSLVTIGCGVARAHVVPALSLKGRLIPF